MRLMRILKIIYYFCVLKLARPSLQKFFESVFRINLGFLGYMNWSPDFKLTGEKLALKMLKNFEIRSILDIGANKGQWAEMAIETLDCNVISIEPQKSSFSELSRLSSRYKNQLRMFNLALGDKNQKIFLNIHDHSSELSYIDSRLISMPLLKNKSHKNEQIKMTTLDTLYQKNLTSFQDLDFIKIDTEGYEYSVLKGGAKFISEVQPKFIQIEMNWHQLFLESSLLSISKLIPNYSAYKILPSGKCFYKVDPAYPLNNIFNLSNFLFVRQDLTLKIENL